MSQSILSGMSGTGSWTLHRRGSALAISRITPLCFKSSIFKHLQSSLLSSLLIACWLSHFRDLQHLASGDETLPSKNGAQLSNSGKPVHASLPWTEFALASKITAQKTEYSPIFLCSEKGAYCLYEQFGWLDLMLCLLLRHALCVFILLFATNKQNLFLGFIHVVLSMLQTLNIQVFNFPSY